MEYSIAQLNIKSLKELGMTDTIQINEDNSLTKIRVESSSRIILKITRVTRYYFKGRIPITYYTIKRVDY